MPDPLPRLILTGASGIVGRGFLQAAQDRFQIYEVLTAAVRTGDRELLLHYIHDLEAIVEKLNAFYRPTEPEPAAGSSPVHAAVGSSEKS